MQKPIIGVLSIWFARVDEREPARDPAQPAVRFAVQYRDDLFSGAPFFDFDRAGVPNFDRSPTVFALGDFARKTRVRQGMIFCLDGEAVGFRIQRRPFRDCPGDEDAVAFEAEVPVQSARVVALDYEYWLLLLSAGGDIWGLWRYWFWCAVGISFLAINFE